MIKQLEYTKETMHNAIAHYSLTHAQPVPEQHPLASIYLCLHTEYDICHKANILRLNEIYCSNSIKAPLTSTTDSGCCVDLSLHC